MFTAFHTPVAPALKTAAGSSPMARMRRRYISVEAKCSDDSLVMAWRRESSMAPTVVSPPEMWATGIRIIAAAEATASIS